MNYSISYCLCPGCTNKFPIPRRKGAQREKGHIKDIYCPYCKVVSKMTEYREFDYYINAYGEYI